MLKFGSNMAVAAEVLQEINNLVGPMPEFDCFHVEAYSNGREQGYYITGCPGTKPIGIAFSENRNSDQIVVYVGYGWSCFTLIGNVPNEEVYRNKVYFGGDKVNDAALFIVFKLKEAYKLGAEERKETLSKQPISG